MSWIALLCLFTGIRLLLKLIIPFDFYSLKKRAKEYFVVDVYMQKFNILLKVVFF